MTEERLAEIRERLEGTAIIGELYVKGDPWKGYEVRDEQSGQVYAESSSGEVARLLANAPKDISELVAEVERLQAEVKSMFHAGYAAAKKDQRKLREKLAREALRYGD